MEKKIKLECGFECTIDDVVLDDIALVDLLADYENNPLLIGKVAKGVFGKNTNALYEHVKTEDGRVPIQSITDAVEQAFNALGEEAKN